MLTDLKYYSLRPPILRTARNTPARLELDQHTRPDDNIINTFEELTSEATTHEEPSLLASTSAVKRAEGDDSEALVCTKVELAVATAKKRPRTLIGSSSDAEDDVQPPAAKKTKQKRKTPQKRRETLEADQWTGAVEPHRVTCSGCGNWIALRSDREYDLKNWEKHRGSCPRITGLVKHRIPIKQAVHVQDAVSVYLYLSARRYSPNAG